MLSHTCKTAIKAVIYLASKAGQDTKAGMKEIAEFINASEHTVGKILQTLVRDKIINSTKGPTGGFSISPLQKKQAIIKVVHAIDGKELFNECGLGLSKCSGAHPCPIHNEYKVVRDLFEKICRENSVGDLCGEVNKGRVYLVG